MTATAQGLAVLTLSAATLGVVTFAYNPWACQKAISAIQWHNRSNFLTRLSTRQVAAAVSQNSVVLIDARWRADYDAGHISGAINIQPTLIASELAEHLAHVPRDFRIVVYCQSARCPYSALVAERLLALGYNQVSLYEGGWLNWVTSALSPPLLP